jgi:hypothetical protein
MRVPSLTSCIDFHVSNQKKRFAGEKIGDPMDLVVCRHDRTFWLRNVIDDDEE